MILEEIFTKEECAYLRANTINELPKVSWNDIREKGIVIYGCGGVGRFFCNFLKQYEIRPFCFIDKKLSGTEYKEIKIYSQDKLSELNNSYVLIGGNNVRDMQAICKEYNIKNILFSSQFPEGMAGYFFENYFLTQLETNDSYITLYNLVADDESKKVLRDIFSFRITHDYKYFQKYTSEDHYFPRGLKEKFDYSVFVDCGAYNGDTFLMWMNNKDVAHKKYIGIEASKNNFKELEKTVSTFTNIDKELHCCALGKERGIAFLNDNESGSAFSSTGNKVDIIPLGELLKNEENVFIKMDIEGAETDTLHGLEVFLRERESKITLAISIYHYPHELYSIPFLILKYAPSAKIYIRHHTNTVSETVCYAII